MKKQGFALIYTLFFIILIGITVFAVWRSSITDINLARKSVNSTQAFNLAKSGLEEAWYNYRTDMKKSGNKDLNWDVRLPDSACSKLNVYYFDTGQVATNQTENAALRTSLGQRGGYTYKICASGSITSDINQARNDKNDYIESVGYFSGTKVRLYGSILHDDDEAEQTLVGGVMTLTGIKHLDYYKYTQLGF